jgi:hypothetical protein
MTFSLRPVIDAAHLPGQRPYARLLSESIGIFHLDGRWVTGRRGERAIRRPVTVDVNTLVSYVLDCGDFGSFFTVVGSDRHGFDGDSDGVACES